MAKRKKSKIDNLEKLHKIIDDLYDSKFKESISKEEKIAKPKTKEFKDKFSRPNDFYEFEKVDVSKPEFLEVKPKEVAKDVELEKKEEKIIKEPLGYEKTEDKIETKTPQEKIISKTSYHTDKKDKMVIFKEAKIDEIYRKTERGILSSDKIQMYKPITIIEMWAFTLILGVVAVSGLFLLRDWIFFNFGIYGDKIIPTIEGTQNIHIWFGFTFAVLGLFHLIIHIFSKKKDILPKQTLRDFKAFLHSGIYLIGLSRRESYGNSDRFYERQRIFYLAGVYILSLTTLTGLFYYTNFLSDDIAMVHIIPGGLSILVLLYHFLITIRKHDTIALRCAFITGKLPRGYVKKNHLIWYKKMRAERDSLLKRYIHSKNDLINRTLAEGGSDLSNALFKFIHLIDESPDADDIEAFTEDLNSTIPPDKLERIIDLSKELEDEIEEEIKQEPLDSNRKSEELPS